KRAANPIRFPANRLSGVTQDGYDILLRQAFQLRGVTATQLLRGKRDTRVDVVDSTPKYACNQRDVSDVRAGVAAVILQVPPHQGDGRGGDHTGCQAAAELHQPCVYQRSSVYLAEVELVRVTDRLM